MESASCKNLKKLFVWNYVLFEKKKKPSERKYVAGAVLEKIHVALIPGLDTSIYAEH